MLQDKPLLGLLVACAFAVVMTLSVVIEDLATSRTDPVLIEMLRLSVGGALTAVIAYRVAEQQKKGPK